MTTRPRARLWVTITGGLALVITMGCAMLGSPGAQPPSSKLTTTIRVESSQDTNHGNVLHMMVRSARPKASAASESYEEAATRLTSPSDDDSILATSPIVPGVASTLAVEKADPKTLILYFFFTAPGQRWRAQLESPLPERVVVRLGSRDIEELKRDAEK